MDLALQLISENKRTQSPFLDLGKCDLQHSWPEEILDCDWLESINFSLVYHCSYDNENKFCENEGHNNQFTGNEGFDRLRKLPRLRSLNFISTGLTNVDFVRHLPRLKVLTLGSNPITDISPISALKHLVYLNVVGARFTDMSPLSHLTDLRTLFLSGSTISGILPISDLSFLRPLTKLRTLYITHSNLTDISSLAELTELVSLTLFCNKITSVNGIQNLSNLVDADLSSNNIKDLLPLYSRDVYLRSLEYLKLDSNKIDCLDLRVLDNMLSLKKISLSNNLVKNVPHDILHYGTMGEIRGYLRRV